MPIYVEALKIGLTRQVLVGAKQAQIGSTDLDLTQNRTGLCLHQSLFKRLRMIQRTPQICNAESMLRTVRVDEPLQGAYHFIHYRVELCHWCSTGFPQGMAAKTLMSLTFSIKLLN
jgi:hypothetical protein